LTKEEGLGKKPLHALEKTRLGVTRMVVIALVAIIVAGGAMAAYIALKPSPAPTPTPTPSPTSKTHTVDYTMLISPGEDYWNLTVTSPYTATLNDSMTVSSGDQYLIIEGENYNGNIGVIWQVWFLNATYYYYETDVHGQTLNSGYGYCNNGLVQVSVTNTAITFRGTTSTSFNVPFENLDFVLTRNGDGNFNGGKLSINVQ
jgi:hypothetical protein